MPQYQLRFQSESGNETVWEIEVHRSYDDADPIPSWINDPVTSLTGSGDPVTIEYSRDYDVYKPIQGSSAELNLLVETAGQYLDLNFAGGNPYEYQLVVRYEDSNDVLQPYWCGFFHPLDTKEAVTTFPFPITFSAFDGLGLLEQSTPDTPTVSSQVSIFETYIVPALRQTGLGLNIHVQSGLLNGANEALTTATSDSFSVFRSLEEGGELFTYKEILEGWLSAFNCKITQAKGKWYIYNSSILDNTTTWKVFNSFGVAQDDSSENLILTIDGSDSQNLVPVGGDLQLNLRRPYGSVECRPSSLVAEEFVANGDFENGDAGWTINAGNQTAVEALPTGAGIGNAMHVVRSLRNYETNEAGSQAFSSTAGYRIDEEADINIRFDHYWDKIDGDQGIFHYQIFADFTAQQINTLLLQPNYNFINYYANYQTDWFGHTYEGNEMLTRLYWNNDESKWQQTNAGHTNRSLKTFIAATADNTDTWVNDEINIPNPTSFYDDIGSSYNFSDLTLHIDFYVASTRRASSFTESSFWVDNISVQNAFDPEEVNPVFERVQADYTTTYTYEPLYSSFDDLSDAIYQKVYPADYTIGSTSQSLAEWGTQWKLNDFRKQFKYYEGSLLNLTEHPLSNIDKIMLNWSTAGYTETAAGIMNGGTFSCKKNTFDTSFYIPDQATNIAPGNYSDSTGVGFAPYNVNLFATKFAGRSNKVVYTLAFMVSTTDASDVAVPNGLVPHVPYRTFIGAPGDIVEFTLRLQPGSGFIGVAGSTSIAPDAINMPLPAFAELDGAIGYNQGDLAVPLTITLPSRSEFEQMYINSGVIPFVPEDAPGTVPCSVVVTNTGTNLDTPSSITYNTSGVPGSAQHFTHHVRPVDDNFQVFAGNFDATYSDSSLTNFDAAGGPDTVGIDFTYLVPTTGESVAVTVTGNASAAGTVGVDLFTRTVGFGTAPANTRFHEPSNIFTGVPGSTHDYFITLIPDADYQITAVAAPTLPSGIVANGAPYRSGENWEIPIQVTIGSSNDSLSITQGAISTSVEPYSITFNVNNLGVLNSIITPATRRITFDDVDLGDSITSFVISVTPTSGFMFSSVNDIIVDINEAQVQTPNGVVTLAESSFTAAIQPALSGAGAIEILIAGNFPALPGNYVLDINIVGNATTGSGANTEVPATVGSVADALGRLSANTGTQVISVTANGAWQLVGTDGLAINDPQSAFSPNMGFGNTNVTVTPRVVLGTNGRLVNSDGSDNPSGATSGTFNYALQDPSSVTLNTGSGTWTAFQAGDASGFTLETSTAAPAEGTADNVITFVTSV